jgi:hypothetical protein
MNVSVHFPEEMEQAAERRDSFNIHIGHLTAILKHNLLFADDAHSSAGSVGAWRL